MKTSATARRSLGPRELAFIIGIPAAWAILLLFHPLGNGEFSGLIDEDITAWVTVHLGMGIFVPLFAGVVWLLLRGVEGPAATVSRIGLAVFALVYAAWELVLGVGSGILAHETKALPEAQQAVGADLIDAYGDSGVIFVLSAVGSLGLAVAMVAAAVALRRAYGVGWMPLLLWVLSMPLIAVHEPPFGPAGLAVFILAALLVVRRQQAAPAQREPESTSRPAPQREGSRLPFLEAPESLDVDMAIIEIDHLVKDYGAVRAVDDLSFEVKAGSITGFLGPNGSGKTTTLRSLLGLVAPTSGSTAIGGKPYRELRDPLSEVGVMLEAAMHPARSARNHLRVLAAEARAPRSHVDELLELVELGGAADRKVGGFSLGMHQRLGLAGALTGDPRILVLDEPANGLDPEGIRWLRDFLRALAGEGRTILLSSHVLAEVAQTVDDAVVINHGRLVVHAPLKDLIDHGSGERVRVRSSQQAALTAAMHGEGMLVENGGESLTVSGVAQEVIGQLAFDHGIVLYEIAAESNSLEDVFLDLTTATATAEEVVR